jgi:hypothetical protein
MDGKSKPVVGIRAWVAERADRFEVHVSLEHEGDSWATVQNLFIPKGAHEGPVELQFDREQAALIEPAANSWRQFPPSKAPIDWRRRAALAARLLPSAIPQCPELQQAMLQESLSTVATSLLARQLIANLFRLLPWPRRRSRALHC